MKTIYLAGPIMNVPKEESYGWRTVATKNLTDYFNILNPLRRNVNDYTFQSEREIVRLDKDDILHCDIVLVNSNRMSIGTTMEIMYAYMNDKLIVNINENTITSLSPWLVYHSTIILTTLTDAITYIKNQFL